MPISDVARYYANAGSETIIRSGAVVRADVVVKVTGASGRPHESVRFRGDDLIQLPGGRLLNWPALSGTIARLEDIVSEGGGESSAFEQSFTGVSSVVCVHNFGSRPLVQVIDDGDDEFIPFRIHHDSANQFTVYFSSARTGTVLANYGGGSTGTGPADTDDLPEGSVNLYFTDGRADARIAAAVGVSVQAYDAGLTSFAALPTVADRIAYSTAADTWAETAISAFGRSLIDDADAAAARVTLGLEIGVDVAAASHAHAWGDITGTPTTLAGYGVTSPLPIGEGGTGNTSGTATVNANLTGPITSVGNATTVADPELAAIAGLTSAADKLPYFTGSGTASLADFTAAARTVVDDTTVAAMVTTLGGAAATGTAGSGLAYKTSPVFTTPDIGAAIGTSLNLSGGGSIGLAAGQRIYFNGLAGSPSIRYSPISGALIFGSSSGTDLFQMGGLAGSTWAPTTAGFPALGAVALGWSSLFLDEAGAGTQTAQIIAPPLAADIVVTTPVATCSLLGTGNGANAVGATVNITLGGTELALPTGGVAMFSNRAAAGDNAKVSINSGSSGFPYLQFYRDGTLKGAVVGLANGVGLFSSASDLNSAAVGVNASTNQITFAGNAAATIAVMDGATLGLDLAGAYSFNELAANPAAPTVNTQARMYLKNDNLVFQFNNAGTTRYLFIPLTGTGVTWTHDTAGP